MNMFHLPGECNPADIMSKHWGYRQVWSMLEAILRDGLQGYGECKDFLNL
jgi:hypothetical protein